MYSALTWIGKGLLKTYPIFENPDIFESESLGGTTFKNPSKKSKKEPSSPGQYQHEDSPSINPLENIKSLEEDDINSYDSEEEDALPILQSDCPLVGLLTDVDASSLELYIYDEDGSFYIHHDLLIPENPLCCEFLQSKNGQHNLVAIGDMSPNICLWDLDCINRIEPTITLPGHPQKNDKATKRKKITKLDDSEKQSSTLTGHVGGVITLRNNPIKKTILCSGSEDQTTKIWDISQQVCLSSYKIHKDKVQSLRWHPYEEFVLLSCSFDKRAKLLDIRQPKGILLGKLPSKAECALWNQHQPTHCFISCEKGQIVSYDVRYISEDKEKAKLYKIRAHKEATTSIADSKISNLLVSCSEDETAKIWDLRHSEQPQLVHTKNLKAGPIFTCQNNPDVSELFAFGGEQMVIWDITEADIVRSTFNL